MGSAWTFRILVISFELFLIWAWVFLLGTVIRGGDLLLVSEITPVSNSLASYHPLPLLLHSSPLHTYKTSPFLCRSPFWNGTMPILLLKLHGCFVTVPHPTPDLVACFKVQCLKEILLDWILEFLQVLSYPLFQHKEMLSSLLLEYASHKSVILFPCQLSLSFNFKNCSRNISIVRLSSTLGKCLLLLLKSFSVLDENPSLCIIFSILNCKTSQVSALSWSCSSKYQSIIQSLSANLIFVVVLVCMVSFLWKLVMQSPLPGNRSLLFHCVWSCWKKTRQDLWLITLHVVLDNIDQHANMNFSDVKTSGKEKKIIWEGKKKSWDNQDSNNSPIPMHCVQIMPRGISHTYPFVRCLLRADSAGFLMRILSCNFLENDDITRDFRVCILNG